MVDRAQVTVAVRRDLGAWLAKWSGKYPKLTAWVEENIEETLSYYLLPLPPPQDMKTTDMLERLNQELERRTHVVRIFPNAASCLRRVRALAAETHEDRLEAGISTWSISRSTRSRRSEPWTRLPEDHWPERRCATRGLRAAQANQRANTFC
jgi:transposase-like protein